MASNMNYMTKELIEEIRCIPGNDVMIKKKN